MTTELIIWTAIAGIVSALATGVGALLAALVPRSNRVTQAFAEAFAGGMMLTASLNALVGEGLAMEAHVTGAAVQVVAGLLLGALAFWWIETKLPEPDANATGLSPSARRLTRRSLVLFAAMLIHSIPEGLAIGVGFATGDLALGATMALIIAVHNIPEGLAIALPVRAEGGSMARSVALSIGSSMPQPILALPALLAFGLIQQILPLGLGFAAGAMLYLVFVELLPGALKASRPSVVAWGLIAGLSGMLLFGALVGGHG